MKNELRIGIFFLVLKRVLAVSQLPRNNIIELLVSSVASAFLLLAIFEKTYSFKIFMIYITMLALLIYTSTQSTITTIFVDMITCIAIYREDFNKVISIIYKYEKFFMAVSFLIFIFSGMKPIVTGRGFLGMRFGFGFGHPNTFSMWLFNLIMMWTWLNFERLKFSHYISIILVAILSYLFTDTRTSIINTVILVLLSVCAKNFRSKNILRYAAEFCVPLISIFIYVLIVTRSQSAISVLFDKILSGRILLGAYAYNNYGLTLLGQHIDYAVAPDPTWNINSFTFDSIYTYTMIQVGIIWLFLISVLYFMLACENNKKVNCFIILWALYGITEIHIMNCYMCFPVLLISLLQNKNIKAGQYKPNENIVLRKL